MSQINILSGQKVLQNKMYAFVKRILQGGI